MIKAFLNISVLYATILAGFKRLGVDLKLVRRKTGELEAVPESMPSPEGDKTEMR